MTANLVQGKQLLRLLNKAKALAEVYTQVDTAVPLSIPSPTHPSYTLDPTSKWHFSALLSTALESATLPTRLRASPASLSDLSTALNVQGHHTISRLRMGIGAGRGAKGAVDDVLDVDLFDLTGEARSRKKEYVSSSYGRVLSQRGEQSDLVYESLFGDPPHPTTTRYVPICNNPCPFYHGLTRIDTLPPSLTPTQTHSLTSTRRTRTSPSTPSYLPTLTSLPLPRPSGNTYWHSCAGMRGRAWATRWRRLGRSTTMGGIVKSQRMIRVCEASMSRRVNRSVAYLFIGSLESNLQSKTLLTSIKTEP